MVEYTERPVIPEAAPDETPEARRLRIREYVESHPKLRTQSDEARRKLIDLFTGY